MIGDVAEKMEDKIEDDDVEEDRVMIDNAENEVEEDDVDDDDFEKGGGDVTLGKIMRKMVGRMPVLRKMTWKRMMLRMMVPCRKLLRRRLVTFVFCEVAFANCIWRK